MRNPVATVRTDCGTIEIELFPALAPNTVAWFVRLAKRGLFDNRRITRIVPGFVIQPSYTSFDDPACNVEIAGEYSANGFDNKVPFKKGTLALGGEGDIASVGDFFITLTDEAGERLNGKFAAFGIVMSGWDEVERLEHVDTVPVDIGVEGVKVNVPVTDEHIISVTVETWD